MSGTFGSVYSAAYDELYGDKDYAAECDLLERIFREYGKGSPRRILDLGCGTGNHALVLAQRGYEVMGVDLSENMLAHARRKAAGLSARPGITFRKGDIRSIDLESHFNAVLMMFAVLGYQLENEDVLQALQTVRRHLPPGGIFVFDVWYGPAVLRQIPSPRVKVVPTVEGRILRAASGELEIQRHLCVVNYHMWHLNGERLVAETEEIHRMRYFFPQELQLFLNCAGLNLIRLGAFPNFDQDPGETTWNIVGVARGA